MYKYSSIFLRYTSKKVWFFLSPSIMTALTLSCVLLMKFVFLQLISIAIPYWWSGSAFHTGLWQTCADGKCVSHKNLPDFFKALQSLQVLGLFAGIFGIVTLLIGKFTKLLRPRVARLLAAVHCIAAGSLILIGIIEFYVKSTPASACFALSLVSAFSCGIIGGRLTVSDEH